MPLRLVFTYDLPVKEVDGPVGHVRIPRIVRDHANRGAIIMQLLEQPHHCVAVPGVEVARRLIRQQDERLADDRPRDRDTLLLAARQLIRVVPRAVSKPHSLE